MKKYLVLYNPYSKRGHGEEDAHRIEKILPDAEIRYEDITKLTDSMGRIRSVPEDTVPVFTGGDGTLNLVANAILKNGLERDVYYFPAGSGNDFIRDIGKKKDCPPFSIQEYIRHLPEVTVKGKSCKFLNGIGAGLDGFCCEEFDRLKAVGKNRSYILIALQGLLGKYKPVSASITVDGETREYDNVYMAPVMFGRYYGGGVAITPDQRRDNPDHHVTAVAVHCKTRLRGLFIFLSVVLGKGAKHPKQLDYRTGHDVRVTFKTPVAIQIDGETVTNVTEYEVHAERKPL